MILVIVFQKEREKAFDDEHEECRRKRKKKSKTKKIKNFLSKVESLNKK